MIAQTNHSQTDAHLSLRERTHLVFQQSLQVKVSLHSRHCNSSSIFSFNKYLGHLCPDMFFLTILSALDLVALHLTAREICETHTDEAHLHPWSHEATVAKTDESGVSGVWLDPHATAPAVPVHLLVRETVDNDLWKWFPSTISQSLLHPSTPTLYRGRDSKYISSGISSLQRPGFNQRPGFSGEQS